MNDGELKYIHNFSGKEYFADKSFPFFVQRYVHNWESMPILPLHSHEFTEIAFVVKGHVTHCFHSEQFGELKYKIYPGDLFIINPGELHTYEIGKDEQVELVNLLFFPQLINWGILGSQDHADLMSLFYVPPFSGEDVRFHSLLKLDESSREEVYSLITRMEYEFEKQLPGYQSLIILKLLEMIICLSRQHAVYSQKCARPQQSADKQPVGDATLKKVVAYIERNYTQEISLQGLTEIARCSPRHLSRVFKKEMGMSVIHFLHYIRVEQSKKYLSSTREKIVTIGQEVGFPDVTFFNKVFKKFEGCTPTQYRQKHKAGV
ncbi:helix-turn-helix domain-containing protein [Cohnella sp. GCM10020058]|uniref:helix-turn-helix domain-containing protein n=1 Tax=Cohnella sp. GCM10020058 TaxID=3317330 RepID=UPI003630F215